jgi:peptidoglycan/xylan/chitin deacetylase (PgdA/CDA1 family)
MKNKAVLSVDVEFFHHTPAYRNAAGEVKSESIGLKGIEFLLNIFEEHGAVSTFFTVSGIAEKEPTLIERVSEEGHEIASHTHRHTSLTDLCEEERMYELKRSKEILSGTTGEDVTGFRAPAFDIPETHFQEVEGAGYRYDSSVAPCRKVPGWYGGEYSIKGPTIVSEFVEESNSNLRELPISVMPWLRLPLTGAWVRLLGLKYTLLGMKLLKNRGVSPVLYIHPWELVDLPEIEGVPKRVYWRTGGWMRKAVRRIIGCDFEFTTAEAVLSTR